MQRTNSLKLSAVLIPVAAVIAIGFLKQSRAAGYLQFVLYNVALTFSGITPILRINIAVQNPSNEKFVVRSLAGTLYVNDTNIGNVSAFETLVVNPNSQSLYPVYVRLSAVSIVQDLISRINGNGGLQMKLKMDGAVNANNLLLPLNITYNVI